MAERSERLDAAREALALKDAESGLRNRANAAQSNRVEVSDNKGNGETADFAPSMISEA